MDSLQGQRVVIAGGSGFLGVSLAHHLSARGAEVAVLSRYRPRCPGPWEHYAWDGCTLGSWQHCLDGAAGLVNLAGRSVNCVKTPDHQDEILRSRVETTRLLGVALRSIEAPPSVWVQISTAHIYGDPPTVRCDEESSLGYGLAPFVGRAWEEAYSHAALPSQRRVVLRTGFVLGRNRGAGAGALDMLGGLARCGLGGTVGSGAQGMSWIHESDMNRLFERGLVEGCMQGTYIASAPNPVPQREFMRELRHVVGMPIGLPAFSWMVRLAAPLLLRTDSDLALYGRYVVSKRLAQEGFTFRYPNLREALESLV